MMGPTLDEMSAFVTVLDRKSFTDAARHLGKSPPRMSELVRNLEERLGVRLVERTTRSVAATEAGERLLTRIRLLLDEYQAALDAMSDFRDKPAGTRASQLHRQRAIWSSQTLCRNSLLPIRR